MTSYNFGTGITSGGGSAEAYPDVSELITAVSNIQANIDAVLGIGDISVVVADLSTAKSNIITQTARITVNSNAIKALNIRTSNLEGSYTLLDNSLDVAVADISAIQDSLEDYVTLSTTQVLRNKTMNYNSNTFINFPQTDLGPLTTSVGALDNRIDAIDVDLINLDLRLDGDETTINLNSANIIAASNLISSNISAIILNSNNISLNLSKIILNSNNLANETLRINNAILSDIALNLRIDEADDNIDSLDARLDVVESASNTYLTSTNTKTITNKTLDYNTNTFLNFPISGEGGATGDVTLAGIQTLTNKTMSFSSNTFTNFPTFDDSAIQEELIDLDARLFNTESNVTLLVDTFVTTGAIFSNNITSLSNAIATTIANIPPFDDSDIVNDITVLTGRVDTVQIDITNLDDRLDIVEAGGGGTGDVTLAGTQTFTNKTMTFADNTFIGFATDFDDTAIQSSLTSLDSRLDLAEDDITDTNNALIVTNAQVLSNSNNIVSLSNALATDISNLSTLSGTVSTLSGTISTHTSQISTNTSGLTTLSNALATDISNLATLSGNVTTLSGTVSTHTGQISTNTTNISTNTSGLTTLSNALAADIENLATLSSTVSTHTTQITTNSNNLATLSNVVTTNSANIVTNTSGIATNTTAISNRVIAPATNTANYLPQWNGANSKTLKDGIDVSTIATLSGTQTLTGKTLDYNTNTFLNLPTGGGGSNFTPSASNVTNINSNLNVSVLNVTNIYKFRAYASAAYDGAGAGTFYVPIILNTETYDLNNNYDVATGNYTVPITGYYDVNALIRAKRVDSAAYTYEIRFQRTNGTTFTYNSAASSGASVPIIISDRLFLTAGDIFRLLIQDVQFYSYTIGVGSYWSVELVNTSVSTPLSIATTTDINYYSYSGSGNIMTGQTNSNNYVPYWSSNNSTYLTNGIDLASILTLSTVSTNGVTKNTSTKTADYTLVANDNAIFDISAAGANITATLPATPVNGTKVKVTLAGSSTLYNLIINRNGSSFMTDNDERYYDLVTIGDNVSLDFIANKWIVTQNNLIKCQLKQLYVGSNVTTPGQLIFNTVTPVTGTINYTAGNATIRRKGYYNVKYMGNCSILSGADLYFNLLKNNVSYVIWYINNGSTGTQNGYRPLDDSFLFVQNDLLKHTTTGNTASRYQFGDQLSFFIKEH